MVKRQAGVAVVTAILIVALAAVVSASLLERGGFWLRQVENQHTMVQAALNGRLAVYWATSELARDGREGSIDYLGESWASPMIMPLENGLAEVTVVDMQGRFNINALVDENGALDQDEVNVFTRLLTQFEAEPELVNALLDWLDKDLEPRYPGGGEDTFYLGESPPYRPANGPMVNINSLFQVKGFNRELTTALLPFLCALPESARLNVNTVSPELLAAALDITPELASKIIEERDSEPFKTLTDFRERLPEAVDGVDERKFTVGSKFFMISTRAEYGDARVGYRALIERDNKFPRPQVLWRVRRKD